jgi:hypothetical protein
MDKTPLLVRPATLSAGRPYVTRFLNVVDGSLGSQDCHSRRRETGAPQYSGE